MRKIMSGYSSAANTQFYLDFMNQIQRSDLFYERLTGSQLRNYLNDDKLMDLIGKFAKEAKNIATKKPKLV